MKDLTVYGTPTRESKDSNIKPVTVKEVQSILYSSETLLQWAAPHLTPMYNFLDNQLSEPWGCIGLDKLRLSLQSVGRAMRSLAK